MNKYMSKMYFEVFVVLFVMVKGVCLKMSGTMNANIQNVIIVRVPEK